MYFINLIFILINFRSLLSEITPLVAHNDEVMLGKALEERNIFKLPSSEVSWIIGKSGLPGNIIMQNTFSYLKEMLLSLILPLITINLFSIAAPNVAEMRSSASPVTMETECTSTSVDTSLREAAAASHQPSSSAKLWPLVNHQPNVGFVHQNFHSTHYNEMYMVSATVLNWFHSKFFTDQFFWRLLLNYISIRLK